MLRREVGVLKWDTVFQFWDTEAVFYPEKPLRSLILLLRRHQ
jgi:hypothetical protein